METKIWYEKKMWVRAFLVLFYPVGLYGYIKSSNKPKKTMIIMSVFWGLIVIAGIVGNEESTVDTQLKTFVQKTQSEKKQQNETTEDINQIEVTFDGQDIINGKQKIVVWVKNNSKDIFTGNLSVTVKSKIDNSKLGSDYVFVEDLNPGQKTYAIIWVKPSNSASADYEWSSIKFIKDTSNVVNTANSPYKFLKDKTEDGGTFIPKIEFYLATDKDFDKMYQFIKARKVNNGVFYHAVFVDDEKYVTFSKYPITAMTFDEEQSKHIIATYQYNTQNGYRNFTYYEKNSWESAPKTKKD